MPEESQNPARDTTWYPSATYEIPQLLDTPDASDAEADKKLDKFFENHELNPSRADSNIRVKTLDQLSKIVENWSYEVEKSKGHADEVARECCAKLFPYGSYLLGVFTSTSDIDVICVGPSDITREDFFTSLQEKLLREPTIHSLVAIQQARAPIITFTFNGIDIDLQYAQYPSDKVPDRIRECPAGLDITSQRAINSIIDNNKILEAVPEKSRDAFKRGLRFLKLYSKVRGIDKNKLGYFGGISIAIMMAYICKMYPKANAALALRKFFYVFGELWKWNDRTPVVLYKYQHGWRPDENSADIFPIITPAEPTINATNKVNDSTKILLCDELKRASTIFEEEMNKYKKTANPEILTGLWERLIEKPDFFERYKTYIQVAVYSTTEDQLNRHSGVVNSSLIGLKPFGINDATHIANQIYYFSFPEEFKDPDIKVPNINFFIGLKPVNPEKKPFNITESVLMWGGSVLDRWKKNEPDATKYKMSELHIKLRKRDQLPSWLIGKKGFYPLSKYQREDREAELEEQRVINTESMQESDKKREELAKNDKLKETTERIAGEKSKRQEVSDIPQKTIKIEHN